MSIVITCGHCNAQLKLRDEFAGKRGKCPKCEGPIAVPALSTQRQAPPAAEMPTSAPVERTSTAAKAPKKPAAAQRTPEALAEEILAAFQGQIPPVKIPLSYRFGILLVSLVMIVLPLIYISLIALVGYGMYWHATQHTGLFTSIGSGRAMLFGFIIYGGVLVAGGILMLFMLKPLFSRPTRDRRTRSLNRSSEPVLFAFIDRICAAVGAAQPKRVDLDMQVNASASFRRGWLSFLGNDLVLTIGLPLVAGMNLRQFAGVLAHEFGHFSQGAGMRLTYVIRTISHWFTRVVYERDSWDVSIRQWAEENDLRIGWIFYLSMFFVWLTRKILWVLMMAGHAVGGYLLRQMEFGADRYEARMSGSDTFAETARRLIVLNAASQGAHDDLGGFYRDGRLADNLPKLILANVAQLPPDVQQRIDQMIAESKTGALDTHPCDKDRIANAAREQAPGIFRLDSPATTLFVNFDAQARATTLEYYRTLLNKKIAPSDLHPIDDLLQRQEREMAGQKAVQRYFQGMVSMLRTLPLPSWHAAPPADPQAALQTLRSLRKLLVDAGPTYRERFVHYDRADTLFLEAEQAAALHYSGIKVPKDAFSQPLTSSELAKKARSDARRDLDRYEPLLHDEETRAGERLVLSLQLLFVPQVVKRLDDAAELQTQCEQLVPALKMLTGRLKPLITLRNEQAALGVMLSALEGNEQNEALIRTIRKSMQDCLTQLRNVREGLERVDFPFDHARGRINIAEYLLPALPVADDLGGIYESSQQVLNGLGSLYFRVLGRLATIGEQVEQALQLPPLPGPEGEAVVEAAAPQAG